MNDCTRLMRRVQMYCFAEIEAALFLDTHPENKHALAYFRRVQAEKAAAVAAYEAACGPLSFGGQTNNEKWDWVCSPWPWETEASD